MAPPASQAIYKDVCTAAFYGDVPMLRKLVEVAKNEEGEPIPVPEDLDAAAQEKLRAEWAAVVNTLGYVTTYPRRGARQGTRFGFDFDITATNKHATVFEQSYKTSQKSDTPATPLHWAVLGNEPDAILYLLRRGAGTQVTVGPFKPTPFDVAVRNTLLSVQNLLNSEEADAWRKVEDLQQGLLCSLDEIRGKTPLVQRVEDIEVTQSYYHNTAGVDSVFSVDASASERDPPYAPTLLPFLKFEEGERRWAALEAHLESGNGAVNPIKDLIALLKTTPGKLCILAERLQLSYDDDTTTTAVQLVTTLLCMSDAKQIKSMLEPDPESELEFPDLFNLLFSYKPLTPQGDGEDEEAAAGDAASTASPDASLRGAPSGPPLGSGIDLVIHGSCREVKEEMVLFCHVKEPEEAWVESCIKEMMVPGERCVTSRATAFQTSGVKERAEEAKQGVLFEVTGAKRVYSVAGYSRFPNEDLMLLPAFTPLEVVEVVPPPEGGDDPSALTVIRLAAEAPMIPPVADHIFFLNKLIGAIVVWQQNRDQLRATITDVEALANPPPEGDDPAAEGGDAEEEAEGQEEADDGE